MKSIVQLIVLITIAMSAFTAQSAQADRKGYRYRAHYSEWDRGFTTHYGYTEERCVYSQTRRSTTRTCYEINDTDYVYIEERIDGPYSRVTVYRDSGYSRPYASYYTYNDRSRRTVGYREYYSNYEYYSYDPYYSRPYYTPYYTTVVWQPIDWNNGWDRILVGTEIAIIGIDALANSHGDAGKITGGVAIGLGAWAIISGIKKAKKQSELQKAINAAAASGGM